MTDANKDKSADKQKHKGNRYTGSFIDKHPLRELIKSLFRNDWSPHDLNNLLKLRYQVDISEHTLKWYKQRMRDKGEIFEETALEKQLSEDKRDRIDVVKGRILLIRLQEKRLSMDFQLELQITKLMPSTSNEIRLLNDMLNDLKSDYQDLGLFPKKTDEMVIYPGKIEKDAVEIIDVPAIIKDLGDDDTIKFTRLLDSALQGGSRRNNMQQEHSDMVGEEERV